MIVEPHFETWEEFTGRRHHWRAVFALRLSACAFDRVDGADAASQRLRDQIDFINALFGPEKPRTIALRYVVRPDPGSVSAGRVDVVLLGKVSAEVESEARSAAWGYFREVSALVGGFMPNHVWEVVADETEFHGLWVPFPGKAPTAPRFVAGKTRSA